MADSGKMSQELAKKCFGRESHRRLSMFSVGQPTGEDKNLSLTLPE